MATRAGPGGTGRARNTEYWIAKLDRNKARDAAHGRRLRRLGWGVLTVWECELKNAERLRARIARFLAGKPIEHGVGG